MFDAYTVGTAQAIGKTRFRGMAGLIIPTDDIRLCKNAKGPLDHSAYDIPQQDQQPKLLSNFKDFQIATLPPLSSFEDQLLYVTFGLEKSFLHADTWCSRYNQAAKEIDGGTQIEKMCAWWNGSTTELAFTPNAIRIPNGCSDTSLIWDYNVLVEESGVFDARYLQVTMDPEEFVIRATALPGPTITGTYRIKVSTTDPSMFTRTWDIEMVFQPCAKPVITPPTLVDQFYAVTGPYADYSIPPFTYSDDKCIGTEEFTNSVAPANTWITGVSDSSGLGSLVGWSTNNEVYAGTRWTVTVENFVGCLRTTVSYDIIIESQCKVVPMTIDPTGQILPSPIAQTQYVYEPESFLSWSQADVAYTTNYVVPTTGQLLDCGPIEFILTDLAGEPVNPALFNANFFDPQEIGTQTDDISLVDIYPLKLTAFFVDYPTNTAEKPFNIEVADLCETPSGNTPSIADQIYKIGTPVQSVLSQPFNYLPDYCPFSLMYMISPDPSDPDAIQFFDSSSVYEFFSSNIDMVGTYTITTTALSPSGAMTDLTFDFDVTFIDPCLEATFDIQPEILSSDPIEYRVGYPSVQETFLDSFAISSETDVECGDIEFVLTNRDGTPVEADAWTWDPIAQQFVTQTSDVSYFNDGPLYPFRLAAKYVGEKYSPAGFIDFDVLFLDPCEIPFDLAASDQTAPPDYLYTGTNPQVDFNLNPFVVQPDYCDINYSCAFISGPSKNLDICNFVDGTVSEGAFDPITGNYAFYSTDKVGFPPGVYIMEVTATVGVSQAVSQVPISLVDPCPTAQLALNPSPFVDAEYVLRDPEMAQQWLIDELATIDSPIDCGPWEVEFFFVQEGPTPPIFFDERGPDTAHEYKTLYTEEVDYVGEYLIKYRVFPAEYPDNFVESPDHFNITITDPCDPPKSLTAPPLADQEYTITDIADVYQIPAFVADPEWCGLTYSYTIEAPEGDSAVTFDSDPESRTFTFENLQDILLAGGESQNYTITVTAEAGITTKITNSSDYTLTIKDPCLDPAFLSIESVPMPTDISYELYQFNQTGFEWPHDPFVVTTEPIAHSLCGNVVYDCIFEGQIVDPTNPPLAVLEDSTAMPMAHDSATNMFNFYAEDRDLIGIRDYACIAKFENYPTTASDVSEGQIEIIDPCLDPDEIQVFEQTDPPDYYYTGLINIFELNAFATWPPNCLFSDYSCSMVSGARLDLCDIIDNETEGDFVPKDGSYTFKTKDVLNYPPGEYVFRITGTSGLNSDFVDITMTLVDPCPTTQLSLLEGAFVNQNYTLRDPPLLQEWLYENVVAKETNAECGPYEIEFFNDDPIQTPLDTNTFFNKETVVPGEFTTLYTEDVEKVGVYPIRYKVRLSRYPENEIVSQVPFNITIQDPCDPPKSLTAPALVDQEYTITDIADVYQIPAFVADPEWCGLTYSYTIEAPEGDSAVTFDSDPESRTFTFENLQDILLAGGESQNYTITVTAEAGITTKITNSSDYTLTIKDPCLDPAFLSIESVPMPTDISYELYQFNQTGFEWPHDPFVVTTEPIAHSLCGNVVYDCIFEGQIVDPTNPPLAVLEDSTAMPMAHDSATNMFNFYAEDRDLIGIRDYACIAKFENYPTTASDVSEGQIEIIDPCLDPDEIQVFEQTDPPDYYYTGLINIFELNAFATWPPNCLFSDYSCSMVSGARLDLCDIIDNETEGDFVPKDGSYTFKSKDVLNYPPGEYVFRITGTSGLNSDFVDITMTLVDPCPTTQLSLLEGAFVNQTYTLRDPPLLQEWLYENVVAKETNAECGPYEIEFFNDDPIQTPLDTNTFFNKETVVPGEFTTLYTEDVEKVGVYPIRYKVRLSRYPENEIVSQVPFNITIQDPCDPPKSLTAPALVDQEYTITDIADVYQIPAFVADPEWCGLTYSYTIEAPEGDSAVTFDSDPESRTFTFENLQDILLAGGESQNYTITVTAEAGITTKITNSSDYTLTIKDPCMNPDFVSVTVAPLLDVSYTLFNFNLTGFEWTHPPFTIVTQPSQHNLCGELVYDATFEGEILDLETRPMFYDAEAEKFNLYAEDRKLVGTRTYSLLAKFQKYPTTASSVQFGKITIIDPCANPNHIVATEQQSPPAYYYTGSIVKFVMNPFETWPPVCAFDYDCVSVKGPDADIQCDLNGNGGGWDEEYIEGENIGTYSFASIDMKRFSPGIYNFTITGRVGLENQIEATTHFVLELRNPCPTAQLIIVDNPLGNIDYFVGENPISSLFNLNNMVTLNTKVDCGPIYMELKQQVDGVTTGVDTTTFNVDQRIPSNSKFTVMQTDDLEKIGVYTFVTRFWLSVHRSMKIQGDSFVVRIMSPCTPERLAIQGKWPLVCPRPERAPIQYAEMPDWMRNLRDQEVCIGDSLEYDFGDPVSIYGDPMDVKVDYKWANRFLMYDDYFHTHEAVGISMEEEDIGYYVVTVHANYTNVFGKQVKFTNTFVQTLIPRCTPLPPVSQIQPDDIVHFIEEWEHGIKYTEEPDLYDPTLPQPFVESLSPTGLLTVGWTQQMVTFTDYQEIEDSKVAIRSINVESDPAEESSSGRRQLYDNWFVDKPGQLEEKIKIFDGIQVNITAADDPDREIKYTWHIQGYDEHFIYFKFDFEEPEMTSEYENFDQIKITFWETSYFESGEGKQVGYGTSVVWGMYRQVSQETADSLDSVFNFFLAGSVIVLSIVLLLLCCGGRLIPTWMFINSLSLLAHLPLLGVMMPSELHYFLWKWLQVFTLHNEALDYSMEVWRMPLSVKNYFKAIGDESVYHILLNDCGYKHAYARNMLILFIIGSVIFVIWVIYLVRAYILRFFCPRYFEKEKACVGWCRDTRGCRKASSMTSSVQEKKGYRFSMLVSCRIEKDKQQKPIGWEPWWANFGIRFAYMVFFELILCVIVNVSVVDFELNESLMLWLTAYFVITLVVLSIGMLSYLFHKGGPYIEHTFKDKKLVSSFWGQRPLEEKVREMHKEEFEEWLAQDTEETRLFLIDQEKRRRFRKRESRRFKKSFWKRITCHKKRSSGTTQGMIKNSENKNVQDELVEAAGAADMQFVVAEDAILSKPLEQTISSSSSIHKAAAKLSPTPYHGDNNVRIQGGTVGISGQRSSHRSGSQQSHNDSRGQDVMMIEHLESSSFSDPKERSIAIERLSRNSENRKSSSSSSSASQKSKANGSYEKIDPQIYVESQPDEQVDAKLDLDGPKEGLSRTQQYSSPVRSEKNQAQNQSNSSFNEQMEQIVSENDIHSPHQQQQIYEGGSPEFPQQPTPQKGTPVRSDSHVNDSRLLISSRQGSENRSSFRQKSEMSHSRDSWKAGSPPPVNPDQSDSIRSASSSAKQSGRHNPYIAEYLDGIIDETTEQDGLQTNRPLMLALTAPVDLDSLVNDDQTKTALAKLDGSMMRDGLDNEKVAKKLSRAQKDEREAQEMYREIKLTPVQIEAKFRIWLSEKIQPTNRYRTLFYGLKLNTPHNVAIVQPLAFILRRILYSVIIVFMLNQAYFGVMLLIATCLFFQVFVLVEKPWESWIINQQHFVNECGLFYVLVHLVLFNGLVNDVYGRMWIGWYMIGIVCLIIIYNWIIILWHCLKIFAEIWSRHQKAYDLYWPGTWCYCCRKRDLCSPKEPSTRYTEEPKPLAISSEPIGFELEKQVPKTECLMGCPGGCDGFTGTKHCDHTCSHDCDGVSGVAHQKRCDHRCPPECDGFRGVYHCTLSCSHDCDGLTGEAHQKSCQTSCSHNCQGTGINHCDDQCETNCDGKTGQNHQLMTKKIFIEIENEPIETYVDHQETILMVPEPPQQESSCSQCCEVVESESSLSMCSFVPDDISKVTLKPCTLYLSKILGRCQKSEKIWFQSIA